MRGDQTRIVTGFDATRTEKAKYLKGDGLNMISARIIPRFATEAEEGRMVG
jgi:hypothetical protein